MKLERLQLRIERDLKEWFERYAGSRGGMSLLVRNFVANLKGQEKGTEDGRNDERRAGD